MIDIVSMTLEHIDEVSEIEQMCFYTPWTKKDFINDITKNELTIYIVALYNKKVVGYAGMWHIVDEGHITNIAVMPQYQHCGVGSKLIKKFIDIATIKKMTGLTLEVRMSNLSAQKLYTKFGFKPEGIRKKYYSDPSEDAIIMWKYFE